MPTQIRDMVPAWSTCSLWDSALANFVFDPPRALVAGSSVAAPTPAWEMHATTSTTTMVSALPAETSYTALPVTAMSRNGGGSSSVSSLVPVQESSSTSKSLAMLSSSASGMASQQTSSSGAGSNLSMMSSSSLWGCWMKVIIAWSIMAVFISCI
jgi:hypothetical protein